MDAQTAFLAISETIKTAVAPVFLLAGIAGFLNVMAIRFGRIVDRARTIERQVEFVQAEKKELVQNEINALWHRGHLINWAIRLCVMGALLVCMVVVSLFVGDVVSANISKFIAALFVTAMLLVIAGLILFLIEVSVSTHHLREGMEAAFQIKKNTE